MAVWAREIKIVLKGLINRKLLKMPQWHINSSIILRLRPPGTTWKVSAMPRKTPRKIIHIQKYADKCPTCKRRQGIRKGNQWMHTTSPEPQSYILIEESEVCKCLKQRNYPSWMLNRASNIVRNRSRQDFHKNVELKNRTHIVVNLHLLPHIVVNFPELKLLLINIYHS